MGESSKEIKQAEESSNPKDFDYSQWKDWYLAIQALFYFAQGAAFSGIILMPNFFINQLGVDGLTALSAQSTVLIPWTIKFLFGILSDNVSIGKLGRRKPYILLAGLLGIFGWFFFATATEFSATVLLWGILITSSVAVADTVFDSMGVDIVPPHRRSYLQGVGWGFRGLGGALSGYLLGVIIADLGWQNAYIILGVIMTLGCFATLLVYEPKSIAGKDVESISFSDFKAEFSKKDTWLATIYNLIAGMGIAIILVLSTFMDEEYNIEIEGIGLGVTFFSLGQFIGALGLGILGQHKSLKKVMVWIVAAYVVIITSFLYADFSNRVVLYVIIFLIGAINGGFEATQMRISLEYSIGTQAASLYGFYNSISNLGQAILGVYIISSLIGVTGSYPVGMQISSVFLVLSLFPGFKAIDKFPHAQNLGKVQKL